MKAISASRVVVLGDVSGESRRPVMLRVSGKPDYQRVCGRTIERRSSRRLAY
tara:strand:+ start:944 stop:1099 length:156 start_codon:yes stop_codon:yes gene_type:complete